jgi:AcrR family transcriptional regulator
VSSTASHTSRKRTPLSRERVLRTAVALADERGTEELTMRKLAKELGVEAMSLYNHVAHKGDLLDGMIDLVFGEIVPPAAGGDWKAELRKRAVSTREALLRHRWAVGQMEGRTRHGPSNLKVHDAVLGCLRAAGFSVAMTVSAMSMQDAYIYGFALQQTDMSSQTPEDFAAVAQRQMVDYAAALADYPNLVEVVGGHVAQAGYDYDREFLFGLDLMLDALERLLPAVRDSPGEGPP